MKVLKVHCLLSDSPRSVSPMCGRRVYRNVPNDPFYNEDPAIVVAWSVWPWIPRRVQCNSCVNQRGQSSRVTPLHELAIEAGLHNLVRHMQTWPDAWRVDPHGTGNNPHVWFKRAGRIKACPCGARSLFVRVSNRDVATEVDQHGNTWILEPTAP